MKRRTLVISVGTVLVVVALALSGQLENAELGALDRLFELRGPRAPAAPIVIVSIDEDSFDELDMPWPFPRAVHAKLVDALQAAQPLAIGFDILFPEPSPRGPADDQALGAAVARAGNVVLAAATTRVSEQFYEKIDMNLPLPVIREGAAAVAPVNELFDEDRHIRRAQLQHRFRDEVLDGWDIAIYKLAASRGLRVAALPASGDALINFRGGPRTFPWIPYHRIVNADIPPDVVRGAIVLIGATSPILQDIFPTPFAGMHGMPGVEIRANILDMLVRGDLVRRVPPWAVFVLIVIAGVGAAWAADRMSAVRAFVAVVLVMAAVGGGTFLLFAAADVWLPPVGVAVAVVLGYGATVVDNYVREQRERRRLSQFFSPSVLNEIVRHQGNGALGSRRRHISVLFSDIRGFTSLSEKVEPEQVVEMLREYLTAMTAIVFKHGGTVDKYIGDCIMALYNAPLDDPQHAVNAVRTAVELLECARTMSARWEAKLGGVQIRNGVGINTGEAVVGAMGSQQRLEYTAIGDTVNLASRLEGLTKEHGVGIIVSESTYAAVKAHFPTRELGVVAVKGKAAPVKIYAVLPGTPRKHRRAPVRALATMVAAGGRLVSPVWTRDISEGGMAVTGLSPEVNPGTSVEIRCEAGTGPLAKPIRANGTVVWRRDAEAGIAFATLDEDAARAVASYAGAAAEDSGDGR